MAFRRISIPCAIPIACAAPPRAPREARAGAGPAVACETAKSPVPTLFAGGQSPASRRPIRQPRRAGRRLAVTVKAAGSRPRPGAGFGRWGPADAAAFALLLI